MNSVFYQGMHCLRRTCVNGHSPKTKMVFKTDYRSIQVKSMLQGEHFEILSTFVKLPFVITTFVLSIFEWPFYTCFNVHHYIKALIDNL